MNCRKVRELLPLHVEGDLSPHETRGVRLHLEGCSLCRGEEAAFVASQAFWKEAPAPVFEETFHADVRRAVRLQIAQEDVVRARWRKLVLGWGAVAGAAATAGLVLLAIHMAGPTPPLVTEAGPVPLVTAAPSPVAVAEAVAESRPETKPERPAIGGAPPRVRQVRTAVSAVSRVTRIEMRTNNPNVRIIWLATASDAAPI